MSSCFLIGMCPKLKGEMHSAPPQRTMVRAATQTWVNRLLDSTTLCCLLVLTCRIANDDFSGCCWVPCSVLPSVLSSDLDPKSLSEVLFVVPILQTWETEAEWNSGSQQLGEFEGEEGEGWVNKYKSTHRQEEYVLIYCYIEGKHHVIALYRIQSKWLEERILLVWC